MYFKYLATGYVASFSIMCGLKAETVVPGTRHPVDLFLRGVAEGAIVLPFTFGAASAIEFNQKWFPKSLSYEEPPRPPVEPREGGFLPHKRGV
jgi:hypothetical protein